MKEKIGRIKILFIALATLLFVNCQVEGIENSEKNNLQLGYNLKEISKDEINSNLKIIEKLNSFYANQDKSKSKSSNKDYSGLNVQTDKGIYLESLDGKTNSYTFQTENQNDSTTFKNLILVSHNGSDYEAYISTYKLTIEESIQLNRGVYVDLESKASLARFELTDSDANGDGGGDGGGGGSNGGDCFKLVLVSISDCDCHITHAPSGCTHPNQAYEWKPADCSFEDDGTLWSDGSGLPNNGSSGGSGGGGSSSEGNTTIPTVPMHPDGSSALPDFLINIIGTNALSDQQINWIENPNNLDEVEMLLYQISLNGSTTGAKDFVNKMLNYFIANPLNSDSATIELFFKALRATNNFQDNLTESFVQDNISYFSQDVQNQLLIDPLLAAQIAQEYLIQRAVKKYLHPNWNEVHIYYSVLWDLRHMALDAFGLIPVIGEVADLANGTLYTIEGDKVNAAFSFASTVPVAGWAAVGVKYAVKIKTVATIGTKVKLTWKVLIDGTIYFGTNNTCRAQLRKVLGLAVGNLNIAHHIIPLNLQTNTIVQKAFKSPDAFHLNEALNGIPLSKAVHNGSHFEYDKIIKRYLDAVPTNASPKECYDAVESIINRVRIAIRNNPNTPINQLIF